MCKNVAPTELGLSNAPISQIGVVSPKLDENVTPPLQTKNLP